MKRDPDNLILSPASPHLMTALVNKFFPKLGGMTVIVLSFDLSCFASICIDGGDSRAPFIPRGEGV
jgi:hypothetical protein